MALEGQKGRPVGAIYREYLSISKKCHDIALPFFYSNTENTDQQDEGFLKK